jgi:hypothetical protein
MAWHNISQMGHILKFISQLLTFNPVLFELGILYLCLG